SVGIRTSQQIDESNKKKRKSIIMVLCIALAYYVLNGSVILIVYYFAGQIDYTCEPSKPNRTRLGAVIVRFMVSFSCVANPIILCIFNNKFRTAAKRWLTLGLTNHGTEFTTEINPFTST